MNKILIIGATSAIAQEVARNFAKQEDQFYLLGKNKAHLEIIASDLKARGAYKVDFSVFDAIQTDLSEKWTQEAIRIMNGLDIVLIAHGILPDQEACQKSFLDTELSLKINFLSPISFLTPIASYFEQKKSGCIAVISSVAGDRGRQSNYVYGTAKGGLTIFLQGLRNRLYSSGVSVLTIKPGFVDTPMTSHLQKGFLFATPKKVGKDIFKAILCRKLILYTPFFWKAIMLMIKMIPEKIFQRLKL